MQSTLWWLAFGDIHDNVSRLEELPGLADATGVIVTGDITVGGGIKQAERSLEAVARVNPNVLAQIGNMDRGEVTEWLETRGWNLHASVREVAPGAAIVGVGASTFTPFGTPSEFPESRTGRFVNGGCDVCCSFPTIPRTTPCATGWETGTWAVPPYASSSKRCSPTYACAGTSTSRVVSTALGVRWW